MRWNLALLLAAAPAAMSAEPASPRLLEQYTHTAWSALDDAPVDVLNFAQTSDGWLWVATATVTAGVMVAWYPSPIMDSAGRFSPASRRSSRAASMNSAVCAG